MFLKHLYLKRALSPHSDSQRSYGPEQLVSIFRLEMMDRWLADCKDRFQMREDS